MGRYRYAIYICPFCYGEHSIKVDLQIGRYEMALVSKCNHKKESQVELMKRANIDGYETRGC